MESVRTASCYNGDYIVKHNQDDLVDAGNSAH